MNAPTLRPSAARVVSILAIVAGGLVLTGSVLGSALPTFANPARSTLPEQRASAEGLDAIEVDTGAAALDVRFGDVDGAVLEVERARGAWILDRDGETLRVSTPDTGPFGWFDGDHGRATLTLPRELSTRALDLSIDADAGDVRAEGRYGDLEATLGAGRVVLDGSAARLDLTVNAGRAELDLADVREVALEVNAGEIVGVLTGTAPTATRVGVNAGSVELTLPDAVYAVRSDVAAGSFDNGLETASTARHTVDAEVAAGSIRLTSD